MENLIRNKHHYKFTTQAQKDLIQIRQFTLTHWGEKQSIIYFENLKETLQMVSKMPMMGKNCADDLGKDIYRFLYKSHAIYYLVMQDLIVIIAILHQSMGPKNHLRNRL